MIAPYTVGPNTSLLWKAPYEDQRVVDELPAYRTSIVGAEAGYPLSYAASSLHIQRLNSITERTTSRLEQFLELRDGWDGYRAVGFGTETIHQTRLLLSQIVTAFARYTMSPETLSLGGAGDGSITLELESGNKCIVISVSANGNTITIYKEDVATNTELEYELSPSHLEEELSWIIG